MTVNHVVLSYFQQTGKKLSNLRHFWPVLLLISAIIKAGEIFWSDSDGGKSQTLKMFLM